MNIKKWDWMEDEPMMKIKTGKQKQDSNIILLFQTTEISSS